MAENGQNLPYKYVCLQVYYKNNYIKELIVYYHLKNYIRPTCYNVAHMGKDSYSYIT